MSWQLAQAPKADANSYVARDWLFQLWKFLTFGSNVVSVINNYNALMEDKYILMNASGGVRTVLLPFASSNMGKEIIIKKTEASGNSVTALPRGTETIDGAASAATTTRATPIRLVSDNSNWILW
jgi:hypothetical protein